MEGEPTTVGMAAPKVGGSATVCLRISSDNSAISALLRLMSDAVIELDQAVRPVLSLGFNSGEMYLTYLLGRYQAPGSRYMVIGRAQDLRMIRHSPELSAMLLQLVS